MLIYNNDGTLAGACGNGARCVADRLCRELGVSAVKIETEAGVIACERLGPWSYRVDMGAPRLEWKDIPLRRAVADTRRVNLWPEGEGAADLGPASVVNMGNPHAVFFVTDLQAHRRCGSRREDRSSSDVPGKGQCRRSLRSSPVTT